MVLPPSSLAKLSVDRKGHYSVGSKLGDGACGEVYKLVENKTDEDGLWAVKVTPKPKPTKNRRSANEVNARLLHHERSMYQSALVQLQGEGMIPKLPSAKNIQPYGIDDEGSFPVESVNSFCRFAYSLLCLLLLLQPGGSF
jgi:hypothetical protein